MRDLNQPNWIRFVALGLALLLLPTAGVWAKKNSEFGKPPKGVTAKPPATQPADSPPGAPPKADGKLTAEQKWLLYIQEQVKATDAEWAVLEPRIGRVLKLQRDLAAGHDTRGPREPKAPKATAPDVAPKAVSPVVESAKALNASLLDQGAQAAEIRQRVVAMRAARTAAHRELTQAQEELRQLLTYRQEAVLIIMGLLE
jgi:hypothetical protein